MGVHAHKLAEVHVPPTAGAMSARVAGFVEEGLQRGTAIDCFDFIPSNARVFFATLGSMPRGRLCEWGSGIGIGIGIAEMLGFESVGIEIDPALASAARKLLADYGLAATVETGSYFDEHHDADVYFNCSWPSQQRRVEEHFLSVASINARLLICYGAKDIRCKTKV